MINLYIGLNGSGKSHEIKRLYDECKSHNKINIPADNSIDDISKNGTKKERTTYDDLLTAILNSFPDEATKNIDENIKNLINKFNEEFNNFSLSDNDIENVEENYKPIIKTINKEFHSLLDSKDQKNYDTIKSALVSAKLSKNSLFKECSDGEKEYNLLLYLLKLMSKHKKTKFTFFIDEIEKHLHKTLLIQLCNFVIELSEDNDFHISTHSETVVDLLCKKSNIKYFFKKNNAFNNFEIIMPTDVSISLIKKFVSIFFAERLIICEGAFDKALLNKWIENNNCQNELLYIQDFGGKASLISFLKWISSIKCNNEKLTEELHNYLFKKIYLVYDKDDMQKQDNVNKHNKLQAYKEKVYAILPFDEKLENCISSGIKNDIESPLSEYGEKISQQFIKSVKKWSNTK